MAKFMLDTNICSYILRKNPASLMRLAECASRPEIEVVISSVVYFELRWGAHAKNAPKGLNTAISEFVLRLSGVLPFDRQAADEAARIRAELSGRGQPIGGYDVMIAGHALATECILVTNNVREFERVPELTLEDWSTLPRE
jgi:tRNA(fMet)-specific endonuclease VapC